MFTEMMKERDERKNSPQEDKDVEVGGDVFEVDTSETVQTFDETYTLLNDDTYGWPRGSEAIAGRQLGQTPLMELVKIVISSQITGGQLDFPYEDENPPDAVEELRDLIGEILEGDHVAKMGFDDLIDAMVSDIVDVGWAYWETIPSEDGTLPVLQLKPVDALTIQHNLSEQGQFQEPAFYHAPVMSRSSGSIQPVTLADEPDELEFEDLVVMRGPHTARSNNPYGQSPAVKAREFLEVFTNSTADINRDYDDTQVPPGIFQTESGSASDLKERLQQSRGDSRKAPVVDYEVNWTDIGVDTNLDRVTEQEWFLRLILAMHGINRNEVGMTENTGLGTETPAQARLIYKKITLPYVKTITSAIKTQILPLFDAYQALEKPFGVDIVDMDPRQEVVEEKQALDNFNQGVNSINETRMATGKEPLDPVIIETGDGEEIDLATQPRYIVDTIRALERPTLDVGEQEE